MVANREKDLGLRIDLTGSTFRRYVDDDGKAWIELVAGYGSAPQ